MKYKAIKCLNYFIWNNIIKLIYKFTNIHIYPSLLVFYYNIFVRWLQTDKYPIMHVLGAKRRVYIFRFQGNKKDTALFVQCLVFTSLKRNICGSMTLFHLGQQTSPLQLFVVIWVFRFWGYHGIIGIEHFQHILFGYVKCFGYFLRWQYIF